jgi:tetratricopeptide (TPR) repeat protein
MLGLALALLLGIVVNLVLHLAVDLSLWISSLISLVVFALAYFVVMRVVMGKIAALMETVQHDIQAGRVEKAIKVLQSGFKYAPWQFYVKAQLNAQIGVILYLKRDFTEAFDYLQKGFVRHWMAMGMLAICYMKRNKTSQMIDTFEKATAVTRKEPLLWNLYAFCLEKVGEKEKAIAALEKGLKKISDERLQESLAALKEGKKMPMMDYGEMWYQFHLEKTGAIIKQQTRAIQGRRRTIIRR